MNQVTHPKPTRQEAVDRLLTQLPTMKRRALEKLWGNLFGGTPCPALRRETLTPILAYRIQEKAFGGLRESTARKLRELAEDHKRRAQQFQSMLRPKLGTHYVREYQGKMHEVTVLEPGFEYGNQTYRSLTEIAKVITGTKRSGPAFFGLTRKGKTATA